MSVRELRTACGLCRRRLACLVSRCASAEGQNLFEFAVAGPILIALALGVIDFGRAYYLSIEVSNAAAAGALYGTQHYTDVTGMQQAAQNDAANVSGMTATATFGCECSDGSSTTASCTTQPSCTAPTTLVYYVQVVTSATYTTLIPWPGIPGSIALQETAKYRAGL